MSNLTADVAFILRHFVHDLPWLAAIVILVGAGFALWPLLFGDGSVEQALDTGAAFAIGFAAILPVLWLRYRTVRNLGGRRTGIAVAMAIAWAAMILVLAWPFLESLDTPLG